MPAIPDRLVPFDPEMIDKDALSKALRSALFQLNLTQKELAERVNVSQPTVSGWVNGYKRPGRKNLHAVAEVLDLDLMDLATPQASIKDPDMRVLPFLVPSKQSSDDPAERPVGTPREEQGAAAGEEGRAESSVPAEGGERRTKKPRTTIPAPAWIRDMEGIRVVTYVALSAGLFPNPPRKTDEMGVVTVTGDAMAPDLREGARVIVHATGLSDSGRYVIFDGETLMVRAVQVLNSGAIKLQPLNAAYDAELFLPSGDENTFRSELTGLTTPLRILGPVVLTIQEG